VNSVWHEPVSPQYLPSRYLTFPRYTSFELITLSGHLTQYTDS
jgi:hypothetical protein